VATAIGPFLGGWLVQAVSWRLIFAINLPVAAMIIAVGVRHVPESRDPEMTQSKVDVIGGILITLGLIGVTYGLIDAVPCFPSFSEVWLRLLEAYRG
jgi:MFS family permease